MFFRFREKKKVRVTQNLIPFSIFHIPSVSETNVTNVRAPGGRRVQGDGLWSNWVLVRASMLPRPFLTPFSSVRCCQCPACCACTAAPDSASGRDNQLVFAPVLLLFLHLIAVLRCEIACSKSSSLLPVQPVLY